MKCKLDIQKDILDTLQNRVSNYITKTDNSVAYLNKLGNDNISDVLKEVKKTNEEFKTKVISYNKDNDTSEDLGGYLEFNVPQKLITIYHDAYQGKFITDKQVSEDNKIAAEKSGVNSDEYIFSKLNSLATDTGQSLFKRDPISLKNSEKVREGKNKKVAFKRDVDEVLLKRDGKRLVKSKDVLKNIKDSLKVDSNDNSTLDIIGSLLTKSTSNIRLAKLKNSNELMAYHGETDTIIVDIDKFDNIESFAQVFLHEVAHDVLQSELKNPTSEMSKRSIKNLENIYTFYLNNSGEFSNEYGFENIDEFISEAISNPEFQNVLKSIEIQDQAYKMGITTKVDPSKVNSIWDAFVNAVRKLLGLNRDTIYNQMVNDILTVINEADTSGKSLEGGLVFKKDTKIEAPSIVHSNIQEVLGVLDRSTIKELHEQYKGLMSSNPGREDKALSIGSKDHGFKWALNNLQAVKYKDSIVLGEWDDINGVFKTRINISPDSKTFLTEMIPYLSENLDVVSFVPTDVASKYERSGYYNSNIAFRYNFKGEIMNKYMLASSEDVIKRLFGEEDINVEDVINLSKVITVKKYKDRIEDLTNVEDRLDETYNKILDNLERQKALLETNEASQSFIDDVQATIDTLSKYEDVNHVKGVIHYLRAIDGQMKALKKALRNKNPSIKEMTSLNKRYKDYLSYYSSINDIKKLYDSAIQDGVVDRNEKITNLIQNTEADYKAVENEFKLISKKFITHYLNDIKYHPKVSTKWTNKFDEEYDNLYKNNKVKLNNKGDRAAYISSNMITNQEAIDDDIKHSIDQLVYNKAFDITGFTKTWVSALETNSDMVQITQTILSETRDKIIKDYTEIKNNHSKAINNLVKSKKSNKASVIYENIYEKDSKGNLYIKGEYNLEFKELNEQLDIATEDMSNINSALENEPDNKTFIEEKKNLSKTIKELNSRLYSIDDEFNLHIKKEFENDLSKLTKEESAARESMISIAEMSAESTGKNKSLVTSINKANYYKTPFITKSNFERRAELDVIGDLKDSFTDLTTIKPDEIGYEVENADAAGNIKHDIPVHFRNYVSPKDQSLDLGTIYLKEAQNAISYKHRKKVVPTLNMLIDVASSKDYIQTKGTSQIAVLSKYSKREKDLTVSGENSRTVERMKGLMENQIYDITKKSAGKFGGVDYHKIVGAVNGYTGMLGMTLNYHSAIVNYTGGYAQLLIQAIGKDVISINSLKKAAKKYANNTSGILKDLNNSEELSYVNQINIMFDTFGGKNIGSNDLLQNKTWKKYANMHGLQFLHGIGEHQMQSVLTMAILDSVQALDENGDVIIDGENKATTLLDNLKTDDKGYVYMDSKVKYNSHSPTTLWEEGGRSQVQQLLKYKIFKTMGNYDDNLQPEIMKTPLGRLVMMYRRFLIPLMTERFQGANTMFKKREDLEDKDKFFSYATKQYEEGNYVTFVRYAKDLLPKLISFKRSIITGEWDKLSKSEKRGVRKTITELSFMIIFGFLAQGLAALADDDDDEALYLAAYTFSRMQSELMQFINPKDTYRITKSPFASMKTIENSIEVLTDILIPFNWHTLNDKYESGKNRDDYKIAHKVKKLIPIVTKFDKTNQELYDYLNSDIFK